MKRTAIVIVAMLTACAAVTSAPPADTVFKLRAGYDAAFLAPAAAYNELPRCPGPALCSSPAVVDQLRKADAAAKALLDGAEDVARNHPELDAGTAIAAATDAIGAATKILATYKIGAN